MSFAMVAVTVSPTLFLLDRISAVVVAVSEVPAARPLPVAGAALEVGALLGVLGRTAAVGAGLLGDDGRVVAAGRLGFGAGVLAPGAGVLAAVSLSSAVLSTGASCRSRLRLSAVAMSRLSPRPQAATAASVSTAIIVLDISASLGVDLLGFHYPGDIPALV
ncbi:MAG TPA: hypothetical protein VFH40_01205 [Gemmatimonadales bacterium]|nr:hypothetical protein [Gemmatimonadales bacterium]